MIEHIRFTTPAERAQILRSASYNVFKIKAEDVIIDLLTDSGTGAMSSEQWSALMKADESYACCKSFYRFKETINEVFGFPVVIPTHQGRAAEDILFREVLGPGHTVFSNSHFDTTRANIEKTGATALDLPCKAFFDKQSTYPFKGDIDIEATEKLLVNGTKESFPLAMLTISNNSCGGQPVSLNNIKKLSKLLKDFAIPLFIDGARFAENAYSIKRYEEEYSQWSIQKIVQEIFSLADGCLVSAKKDGLVNIGGFIALRDEILADRLRENAILTEGFFTYGGLSGRDLECMSTGLKEVLSLDYLASREALALHLAKGIQNIGAPVLMPPGLHAVYLDAREFYPHLSSLELPGQVLVSQLYLEGGIRSCEVGTVMFGRRNWLTGEEIPHSCDLVRLALPRRVYTSNHFDYVIESIANIFRRRHSVSGLGFLYQSKQLRHFTASFEVLEKPCLSYSI